MLTDAELDDMLSGLDERLDAVRAELRTAEDEDDAARRIEAARDSLPAAADYDPVHAEWYEDPDSTGPHDYLSYAASREEIRRAYRKYGARFEVDKDGELTLRIELPLDGATLRVTSSC